MLVPASTIPTPSATPVTIVHQSSPQPPVSTIAPGDNPAGASPLTSGFPTTQEQMRQEHLKMQQLVLQTRVNAQQQLAEHRHTMAQRGQPPPKPPPASTSRVKKSSAAPTLRRSASTSKANPAPSTPLTASAPAASISLRVHSAPEEPSTVTSASAAPDGLAPFALTDFNFDELLDPHGPRISMDAMIGNLGTCGDQYGHLPDRGLLEDLDPAVLSRLMQDPGSGLDFFNHQFFADDPTAPSSGGQDG
ncbi:hypothetical protein IWQ60_009304 [Tieghemiomyces parasiticus]|uniref:Uncharacterized protein n=1 Tax=Tieghemiomyces parasiticus TaxID=78921 RepID=A0A9W8DPS6_9FUNG|nr:hypothetical protein IWQ60_009304 [Tieghemiomyces parasiticus]